MATLYLRHLFAIRTRPSLRKSLAPEAKALLVSARQCQGELLAGTALRIMWG